MLFPPLRPEGIRFRVQRARTNPMKHGFLRQVSGDRLCCQLLLPAWIWQPPAYRAGQQKGDHKGTRRPQRRQAEAAHCPPTPPQVRPGVLFSQPESTICRRNCGLLLLLLLLPEKTGRRFGERWVAEVWLGIKTVYTYRPKGIEASLLEQVVFKALPRPYDDGLATHGALCTETLSNRARFKNTFAPSAHNA